MSTKAQTIATDMLVALWRHYDLGTVEQVTTPSEGVRNPCFFINDQFVARFNTQDQGSAKFRSEQIAYTRLAEANLPVPTVVLLDETHELVPYDVIVTTRLAGRSLVGSWQELPAGQVVDLLYHAGRYLAMIHNCTFPAFGKLRLLNYPSWSAYVEDYVQRYLIKAHELALLPPTLAQQLETAMAQAMVDLASVVQGVLVHCDYHYENILQQGGQISGLLDFEWALSGDPAYDLMIADVRNEMIPGSEVLLRAGYQSLRPFDPAQERRIYWYRLFLVLEEAVMFANAGEQNKVAERLQSIQSLLLLT